MENMDHLTEYRKVVDHPRLRDRKESQFHQEAANLRRQEPEEEVHLPIDRNTIRQRFQESIGINININISHFYCEFCFDLYSVPNTVIRVSCVFVYRKLLTKCSKADNSEQLEFFRVLKRYCLFYNFLRCIKLI